MSKKPFVLLGITLSEGGCSRVRGVIASEYFQIANKPGNLAIFLRPPTAHEAEFVASRQKVFSENDRQTYFALSAEEFSALQSTFESQHSELTELRDDMEQMCDLMTEIGAHPDWHNSGAKAMEEVASIINNLRAEVARLKGGAL